MKLAVRAGAAVLLLLGIVTARVVWSSRTEWRLAESSSGDERLAHLGRAARLYAPGNPFSRRALRELERTAELRGPDELANWRVIRSAILATRSFYTPETALLDKANARIALLMAASESDTRGPLAERQTWHAARLAQDDAPSVGWTLVALLGLAAWIASAVGFFLRGVDEHDRLRRRPAAAFAVGIAVGLALFFVGLARA